MFAHLEARKARMPRVAPLSFSFHEHLNLPTISHHDYINDDELPPLPPSAPQFLLLPVHSRLHNILAARTRCQRRYAQYAQRLGDTGSGTTTSSQNPIKITHPCFCSAQVPEQCKNTGRRDVRAQHQRCKGRLEKTDAATVAGGRYICPP
jgi:hypothetical protein